MRASPFLASFLLLSATLSSCGEGGGADPRGIALREDGWLRGDCHVHTNVEGGFETLASVIALAESLESPAFLELNPDYEGHGLDFLSITDHDSVAALSDPDFHSERLVLVGGEEWSGNGHANCLGIRELVEKDLDGDGKDAQDVAAAKAHTHAQGGVFSMNHPMLADIPFPWDPRGADALEVWNSGFSIGDPALTTEALLAWEAEHGPASPFVWRAAQVQGRLCSGQNLALYEALLARGEHLAAVGGSDRHAVLLPGFPTTWVRAESPDEAGVIEAIRARHTFVSRNPAAPQVLLEVRRAGRTYGLGDQIPVPTQGAELAVRVRVGRGDGAQVRLVVGGPVASDEALAEAELGRLAFVAAVAGDDFQAEIRLQVQPGDWLYPLVLEPLVRPDASPEQAEIARAIAEQVAATASEDYTGLAQIMLDYIDSAVLVDSSLCDPADWQVDEPQCRPEDPDGLATYYLPDWLDRTLNARLDEGRVSEWILGAVGSAVLCAPETP